MADTNTVQPNTSLKDEKIAIIGSGLIGRSWAMLFACGGYQVSLCDTDFRQLESALVDIRAQLTRLAESGQSRGTLTAEVQFSRITTATSLKDSVKDAVYIQIRDFFNDLSISPQNNRSSTRMECIPENKDLKRRVLKELSDLMDPSATLASSTSALMPSLLSDHLTNRGRFIVAHPVNPPFYVPVVEIVPAPWTEPSVTSFTSDLMENIGQVPVVFLKEVDGFGLGRIQFAIQAAAYELIKDGYCDVDDVETAMTEGLGMWYAFYGPFEVEHLNADGYVDLCAKYGEAIFRVQETFAPPEMMGGETARAMAADLEKFCPLDKLQEKRQWRDSRLAALSRLLRDLDTEQRDRQNQS